MVYFSALPLSLEFAAFFFFFYLYRGLASFFSAPILVVFSLLPFGLSGSLLHSPFRPWVLGLGFSSLCILFPLYFTKLSVQEVLLIGRAKRYLLKTKAQSTHSCTRDLLCAKALPAYFLSGLACSHLAKIISTTLFAYQRA